MPKRVLLSGGGSATYIYDASGVKYKVIYQGGGENKNTEYSSNVIYENGELDKVFTEEGYITCTDKGIPTYHYYLTDHLGNNRVVMNQDGTIEQVNHYYPFGGLFDQTAEDLQAYKYNGKELDRTYGLDLYDYSARYMDGAIGRFTTMDPMAEKYYAISPYAYCANNPVRYVDPTGMVISPYYDEHGNYLGVDENGFSEDIYITTKEAFEASSTNGIADSKSIQANENTISFQEALPLSSEAESKIYTDVLMEMDDIKIDNLYKGEVSIRDGLVRKSWGIEAIGYNNPAPTRNQSRFSSGKVDGQIRVTAQKRSFLTDLYTVESIQSHLGVHEYWSHGVKGWGDKTKDHHKAYRAQMDHKTFKKLPKSQQAEIEKNYLDYKRQEGQK